ncbi:hypothetical protein EVAR_59532_1 [Eumeta japonica]|uniref:Secreted protein n=1 Tax=Eumeta variegata TaxID=151549 RepID=A0A4C1XXE3_EUMVA|nr:hypothetical protein EVAR_59532_1 [Eumeta japonica]
MGRAERWMLVLGALAGVLAARAVKVVIEPLPKGHTQSSTPEIRTDRHQLKVSIAACRLTNGRPPHN